MEKKYTVIVEPVGTYYYKRSHYENGELKYTDYITHEEWERLYGRKEIQ